MRSIYVSACHLTNTAMMSSNRASPQNAGFVTVIVKAPVIQILTMIVALFMIALEFPLPQLRGTMIHRSFVVRIVMLLVQAFLAIMFYQVSKAPCSKEKT